MKQKRFIIEAGHHFKPGKGDPGAVYGEFSERDLTKHAKERIAYYLNLFYPDIEVLLDSDTDTLSEVLNWIRSVEGVDSIIYSLHWNAATPSATGVESFISNNASEKSKTMAKRANDVVVKISGLRDRGVKTESQSARGKLGVLNTKSPATLIEFAFITNDRDRETFFEWQEQIYITLAHEFAYQASRS